MPTATGAYQTAHITDRQRDELTDGWGLLYDGESHFTSDNHAARAWATIRDEVMTERRWYLQRPRGWWLFDSGLGRVPEADKIELLHDLGAMTPREMGADITKRRIAARTARKER